GAADVLDDDVRLAGNVRGQMLSDDAPLDVGRAARRVVDDHGNGLALVELRLRAVCDSKRRQRDQQDQTFLRHGFDWRCRSTERYLFAPAFDGLSLVASRNGSKVGL